MKKEFIDEQLPLWNGLIRDIFSQEVPESATWSSVNDILNVLSLIAKSMALNHTFLPESGGLDLNDVLPSHEPGCLELRLDGAPHIVKPKRLVFQSFPDADSQWFYFRFETGVLQPTGIYDELSTRHEELGELSPGQYIDRGHIDSGYYQGEELPRNARVIVRILSGDFVIFSKASLYNRNSATYDARHEKMGHDGFKRHIQDVISYLRDRDS